MRLTFMQDYYLELFDKAGKQPEQAFQRQQPGLPSALPVAGPANAYDVGNRNYLASLQQQQIPQSPFRQQLASGQAFGSDRHHLEIPEGMTNSQQAALSFGHHGQAPGQFGFKQGDLSVAESEMR